MLLAGRPLWIKPVMSDYTFTEELFSKNLYDETYPLLLNHWKEMALDTSVPLAPNYEVYQSAADLGNLHCLACRLPSNKLIGYMVTFLMPSIHYKNSLYAENDLTYIDPEYRQGFLYIKMLREFESQMKMRGVEVIHLHVTVKKDFGSILERAGYARDEIIYRKKVGK
jgi:hypothetical protein